MAKKQRVNVVQEVEESAFELDSGDLTVGIILLFIIPFAVYLTLSVVGYPVKGNRQVSHEEMLAIKEKKQKRKPPRLDKEEVNMRLKRVDLLLDEHVPKYRAFRAKEEKATPAHHFFQCAQKCLGVAEKELKMLKDSVPRNPDLRGDADRIEQKILSRLQDVQQIRQELSKENVFVSNK